MKSSRSMNILGIRFPIPLEDDNRAYLDGRYPYESTEPLRVMKLFDVKFPFKAVIDKKTSGTSTCLLCGKEYEGFNYNCTHKANFWVCDEQVSKHVNLHRQFLNKDDAKAYMNSKGIKGTPKYKLEKCESHCHWNLEFIFDEQRHFFKTMESLVDVAERFKYNAVDSLLQYRSSLPDGMVGLIESEFLRSEIYSLQAMVMQLMEQIKADREDSKKCHC